jgi:hypothetical protein
MRFNLPQGHAEEKRKSYEIGKRVFFFRGGPMDFSCASCHGEDGKRIRLQDLPNLTKNPGDGIGFAAWPAYRVSNGQMWSMQLRLNDCYRQQRFPVPGLRLRRDDRAGHLHGRQCQGCRVDRAGHQALNAKDRCTMKMTTAPASHPVARDGCGRCSPLGCASCPPPQELDARPWPCIKASFRDQGIAKVDRIKQDLGQSACSSGQAAPDAVAKQIEAQSWRRQVADRRPVHRRLARRREAGAERPRHDLDRQSAAKANGGNCYNCHQIEQAGDLLRHHRPEPLQLRQDPRRGDVTSPAAQPSSSTPGARSTTARPTTPAPTCRASAHGLLDEKQIRHLMALAARPEVAGQPISLQPAWPRPPRRAFSAAKHKHYLS